MSISLYDAVPGRQYKGLTLDGLQTGELSLNLYGNPYGVPNAGPTETTPNNPYYLVNASGRHRITTSILIAEEAEALLKRRDIGEEKYGCDARPSPLRDEIQKYPAKFRELLLVYTEEEGRLDKLELFKGEFNGDGGYTFAIDDPTTVTPFEKLSFCWVNGKAVEIRNTNICSLPGPSAEEVFANKARFHERLWIYYKAPWSDFELGEIFKAERFVESPRLGKVYKFKDYIIPRTIEYLTFCILSDRINIPDCTLCLEPVGLIRYTPLCGNTHTEVYHRECLSNIIRVIGENGERETRQRCPICRSPFTQIRDTPVYELASAPPLPAEVSPVSTAPTAAASAAVPPVSAAPTAAEIGPQSPSALAAAAASARARSRGCFGFGCVGGRSRRSKKYRKQKTKRKLKRRTIRK